MNEFEIIKKYFQSQVVCRQDVLLGSGDDCALLSAPTDQSLAVSIDTLISDTHFPVSTAAYDIGYKALAVGLSDLAAMGASPAWFTCTLTLPDINPLWLKDFSKGLFDLAKHYEIQLIGGDLTRGKILSVTIQVHGFVPFTQALRRDGAKIGDAIYVSNSLGTAGYVLQQLQLNKMIDDHLLIYLNHPEPQIALGLYLRDKSRCAIDISDGLVADLKHILKASQVGASIYIEKLPLGPGVENNYRFALTAGDDYQLCFTAPADIIFDKKFSITRIGQIEAELGLRIFQPNGELFYLTDNGYQHF